MRRVVVTGAGLLTPAGIGRAAFDAYLDRSEVCIRSLTEFVSAGCPIKVAGLVPGFSAGDFVPQRLAKRCDRFSHLALAAADLALKDAALDLEAEDRTRVGVLIGNNLGGWEFGQQGLYDIYRNGAASVSPYQAIAWFPGAPQGQVSIHNDLKGYSKTVIADRASGLAAVAAGARAIRLGQCDVMLAGGTEAPIAAYSLICYLSAGDMSHATDPGAAFLPFDARRSGLVLAEGGALLTLEDRDHAIRRRAPILGEIVHYGIATDTTVESSERRGANALARAMTVAMSGARWSPERIDYVCADGSGTLEGDRRECLAIRTALGEAVESLPVSAPKAGLGHMLGAAGATDVYATLRAMTTGEIAPMVSYQAPDAECTLDFVVSGRRPARIRRALVNSHGRDGTAVCIALAAAE